MNRVKAFLNQNISGKIDNSHRPFGWLRFSWDLTKLPDTSTPSPNHYEIVRANAEDAVGLRKIFSSSFMLDPTWSPDIAKVMPRIQATLDSAFEATDKICLALRHGARIIGGAILLLDGKIDNQLSPGPTISLEYRNRGFGKLLLEYALRELRDTGLTIASGSIRENSAAARFLYPKFGGVAAPIELSSFIAAA